ncbi:hypothetical protein ACQL2C_001710 [Yersinia enterocolitica]
MAQDFYSLGETASRSGVDVDVFIQAWLEGKLPLYIYFGNASSLCTLRRCVSARAHEHVIDDIIYGRDFYQSKASPDNDALMFIPETPLSAHLKVKARYELGGGEGPEPGGYYEYRYEGYARGYWTATPTMVAHFSRGKYLLTDKESFERKSSSIGDVIVHAHDKSDFIIFSENLYIDKLSFFVKENDVKDNLPELWRDLEPSDVLTDHAIPPVQFYRPPNVYFALYLMISEWCPKHPDGKPMTSKLVTYFNETCKLAFTKGSISRWAERPELKSNIQKREMKGHREALSHLLQVYCDENKIDKMPTKVTETLNELARVHGYGPELLFDTMEVTLWLKESYDFGVK